jgi:hypothetical protein
MSGIQEPQLLGSVRRANKSSWSVPISPPFTRMGGTSTGAQGSTAQEGCKPCRELLGWNRGGGVRTRPSSLLRNQSKFTLRPRCDSNSSACRSGAAAVGCVRAGNRNERAFQISRFARPNVALGWASPRIRNEQKCNC